MSLDADKFSGFTLVELVITITIAAILMSIAIPGMNLLLKRNAQKNLIAQHFNAFAFARSQAALQLTVVTLCPLNVDGECHDDWDKPVSVFPDSDRDGKPDDGIVWRVFDVESQHFSTTSRTGGNGYFRYSPDGTTYGLAGGLVVCPNASATGGMTYLALNKSGRLRKAADRDNDGIITTYWGATIRCPQG